MTNPRKKAQHFGSITKLKERTLLWTANEVRIPTTYQEIRSENGGWVHKPGVTTSAIITSGQIWLQWFYQMVWALKYLMLSFLLAHAKVSLVAVAFFNVLSYLGILLRPWAMSLHCGRLTISSSLILEYSWILGYFASVTFSTEWFIYRE